jgi:hypothetical protein
MFSSVGGSVRRWASTLVLPHKPGRKASKALDAWRCLLHLHRGLLVSSALCPSPTSFQHPAQPLPAATVGRDTRASRKLAVGRLSTSRRTRAAHPTLTLAGRNLPLFPTSAQRRLCSPHSSQTPSDTDYILLHTLWQSAALVKEQTPARGARPLISTNTAVTAFARTHSSIHTLVEQALYSSV